MNTQWPGILDAYFATKVYPSAVHSWQRDIVNALGGQVTDEELCEAIKEAYARTSKVIEGQGSRVHQVRLPQLVKWVKELRVRKRSLKPDPVRDRPKENPTCKALEMVLSMAFDGDRRHPYGSPQYAQEQVDLGRAVGSYQDRWFPGEIHERDTSKQGLPNQHTL